MKTHYLTYILRLRLDETLARGAGPSNISGSLQQVGLVEIVYFDSLDKFQESWQRLAAEFILKEVKDGKYD